MKDLQAGKYGLDISPRVEGHVGIIGPAIASAEQLPGEDPARDQGHADTRPYGWKFSRRAERQAEAGVNQVGARKVHLGKRSAYDLDSFRHGGRDTCPERSECNWLGVYGRDFPPAAEQLECFGAFATAQVDRRSVSAIA